MRSIFLAIHYLELGGAEMSLIGLLESLDYSEVQVDLFVYAHRGELLAAIPPQVNLLPEIPEYAQIECPIKDVLRNGFFRIAVARLRAKREYARYARRKHPKDGSAVFAYVARRLAPLMPAIHPEKEYDLAVSYLTPHDYVLRHVKAIEKVAWIHTDYSQIDVNSELELPVWAGYDKIISISDSVTRSFLEVFPSLADRVEVRKNRLPKHYIQRQAEKMTSEEVECEMPKCDKTVNILSVGRFCYAKNYDNVPDICRRLNDALSEKGLRAVWYLIGFGGDEPLIRRRMQEEGKQGQVVILGKKDNPYPYMKACDIYVQPSCYEGDPVTVKEAAFLGKRVVLTAFPTAEDVVKSIPGCSIVPLDNAGCAIGLASLIQKQRNDS
jgi:glycosyltransferase involved in cell wall biosynthesis